MGGIYQGIQFEEAIGAFEKTGELDPTHPLPKVAIGDTYMAMNKYKDALKYYEIAAAMPRKHGCAFVGKAHALYRMGRTAAGLRVAETAYEMAQTCNITSYKLGLFYLLIAGMTDRAIECLENCIKLDPDDHMAYRVLAEVTSRAATRKRPDYMTRADRIAVSPSSKLKEHWATVKVAQEMMRQARYHGHRACLTWTARACARARLLLAVLTCRLRDRAELHGFQPLVGIAHCGANPGTLT